MPDEASTVSCPHCGQTYAVTAEQRAQYGSQPITCTKCRQPFTAGGAPMPAATPPPMAGAAYQGAGPGGPPVGYASPGPYGVQRTTSGWAVASLVLGCLSLFIPVIAPIGAVVTGAVGLSKTRRPGVGGRGLAIAGLSLGIAGFVLSFTLLGILLPSLNRAREAANRIKCASNLRMIGQAAMIYSNENRQGQFPDTLEQLVSTGLLTPDALVCPSSADTIAPGATPEAQVASLATPGHMSYVYVGKGLTNRAQSDVVLAYEPPGNHRNDGMNVLFADGHVDWVAKNVAPKVVAELEAGQNPPPSAAGF